MHEVLKAKDKVLTPVRWLKRKFVVLLCSFSPLC